MDKRSIAVASALLAIVCSVRIAAAQSLPSVKGARVSATATSDNGMATFHFIVSTSSSSSGAVAFLYIDVSSRCLITAADAASVAVMSPSDWIGDVTPHSEIGWLARAHARVQPGQTLHGFSVSAPTLVGICPFRLRPSLNTTALGIPSPELEGDLPEYFAKVQAIVSTLTVAGTTIGPARPPAVFDAMSFLDSIIADKEAAYAAGWIDGSGIKMSLDAKLNAARASLRRGNTNATKNQLKALLKEIDAQAGKHLTSEVVGLLKINTVYLISKMF